ncbi:MAG: adenylate/guanylate cyclase domain-containing protein [Saprospiraceae bacterium]
MYTPSFIDKLLRSKYGYLNEEQFGVISLVLIFSIILFGVLSCWTIFCYILNISEMVILDGIGVICCLVLIFGIISFGLNYQWSRLIVATIAITVACTPMLFYGTNTLFILNVIIVQMSSMLLFTRQEKKVMVKYLIAYLLVITLSFIHSYWFGPPYFLSDAKFEIINLFIIVGGIGISFYFSYLFYSENNKNKNLIIEEKEKSDRLLLSIFPKTIAEQLRESTNSVAEKFDHVTVVFIDLVDFTKLSNKIPPSKLVALLDNIFSAYDEITEKYKIEKIKTIGDAYMAVCGLPNPDQNHCNKVADMALDIIEFIENFSYEDYNLKVRIGIHTGEVVAGVIGNQKFSYDLWGDTVNIASRFEASGISGKIHITEEVKNLLGTDYTYEYDGEKSIKGKGKMKSYFLTSKSNK